MKKQILSIVLMIIAILIVCAGLFMKKQNSETQTGNSKAEAASVATTEPVATPTTEAPTATPTPEPTEAPIVTPTTEPTEAPTVTHTTEPTKAPTAAPTTEPTEAPTAAPTTKPTEAPTATDTQTQGGSDNNTAVTDAYTSDMVNELTSYGLTAEDINSLADMGVTEEEIQSVTSAVEITPEMVAELQKYKDVWASASELERKLMIEMLKQLAGQ